MTQQERIMLPNLKTILAFFITATLLVSFLPAQVLLKELSVSSAPISEPDRSLTLGPGESVMDSDGRTIQNNGTKGVLKIKYKGKSHKNGRVIEITGKITGVKNPKYGGTRGPVTVKTNNKPTTVDLEKNGLNNKPVTTKVEGGNSTVNVSSNNNNVTVGGMGNQVDITGNNNTGQGENASSGGDVNMGGRGNSWSSNGGRWTVRN